MAVAAVTVRLLQADPELARYLSADLRPDAERLAVPVLALAKGPIDLDRELRRHAAFGAIVLDGMILQRMRLANHTTMKLQGPGGLVSREVAPASMLVADWSMSAVDGTALALLGNEFLAAVRRWPALTAGLHARLAEQTERLAVQLAICQLSRVDDRLLALLWWLAEAWGRVTTVGTVVPINMTHDVLGALVGARRPTVTLALGELVERGAIVRQDRGWLLLEAPPGPERPAGGFDDPQLIAPGSPVWRTTEPAAPVPPDPSAHVALLETVHRPRVEHEESRLDVGERLEALRTAREALNERRRERQAATRPPAPS